MATVKELEKRVNTLEKKLNAAITALHLFNVSAKPTSDWLDAVLDKINKGEE